jgi:SAM-dependent methyltransferase
MKKMKSEFRGIPVKRLSLAARLITSLRHQGFKNSIIKIYELIADKLFDIRYGIDTCTWSQLSELTIDSDNIDRGLEYEPTRMLAVRKLFNGIKHIIPADSVFVDFGCGKGRVLLVASEFGFREARGVEFAHELSEIARKNCEIYKIKTKFNGGFKITEGDVANYAINIDENVFFNYNSFDEVVMSQVLRNIIASLKINPRKILLIFNNFKYEHLFELENDFILLQEFSVTNGKFIIYSNRD